MKHVLEYILLGASIILVCGLVGKAFYAFKQSERINTEATKNQNNFANELTEYDLTMYEGREVQGSDVVNFINRHLGDYIATETAPIKIIVTTALSVNTYNNREHLEDIQNFSSSMYIKPKAIYLCTINRDKNNVISDVIFTQK